MKKIVSLALAMLLVLSLAARTAAPAMCPMP